MTDNPTETRRIFVVVPLSLHKELAMLAIKYEIPKADTYLIALFAGYFGIGAEFAIKDYVEKSIVYDANKWCDELVKMKVKEHETTN